MSNNGGVIGVPVTPTFSAASGVWRPSYIARQLAGEFSLAWPLYSDPSFSSVILLCHFDDWAADGLVQKGSAGGVRLPNGASLSTTRTKFSKTSLWIQTAGTNQYAQAVNNAAYALGSGDWTIEFWVNPVSLVNANIFDMRTAGVSVCPCVSFLINGSMIYFVNNSTVITGTAGAVPITTWTHVALSKVSGTTRMFINGTQDGSNYTDSNNYAGQNGVGIGNSNIQAGIGSAPINGYMAEVRITKGVGRYTTTFTAPTTRFADY